MIRKFPIVITIHSYSSGAAGQAQAFTREMLSSGNIRQLREPPGNLRYEYFVPITDPNTVLLIDPWADQAALDRHHAWA